MKKEFENQISDSKSKTDFFIQNNNNCNNNINNVDQSIHIHVNNIGTENIEYLSKDIKECMITNLIGSAKFLKIFHKQLHFNPEHPENHNICKTDKSRNTFYVKVDGKMKKVKLESITDDIKKLYEKANGYDAPVLDLDESINAEDVFREFKRVIYELSIENKDISSKIKEDISDHKIEDKKYPILDIKI